MAKALRLISDCFSWICKRRSRGPYYDELDEYDDSEEPSLFAKRFEMRDPGIYNTDISGADAHGDGLFEDDGLDETAGNPAAMEVARRVTKALKGDSDGAFTLERGKVTNTGVKLIFDRFSHEDLRAVCRAVRDCETMVSVEFGCNGAGNAGVSIISESLRRSPRLQNLAVWGNSVTDAGANSLADLVSSCPKLASLVLCNNEIGDNGLAALALAIASSRSLKVLDLSVNSTIGDAGVAALVKALRETDEPLALESLVLNNDTIGNEGARQLAAYLASDRCTLLSLDISFNVIEDAGAKHLAQALQQNGRLKTLNVSGNLFNKAGSAALMATLQGCKVPDRQVVLEDIAYK